MLSNVMLFYGKFPSDTFSNLELLFLLFFQVNCFRWSSASSVFFSSSINYNGDFLNLKKDYCKRFGLFYFFFFFLFLLFFCCYFMSPDKSPFCYTANLLTLRFTCKESWDLHEYILQWNTRREKSIGLGNISNFCVYIYLYTYSSTYLLSVNNVDIYSILLSIYISSRQQHVLLNMFHSCTLSTL